MKLLFVCLGNICRSPMAEAVMRSKLAAAGIDAEVDSAGTAGYHIGEPPHSGTCKKLREVGISYEGMRGRRLEKSDYRKFDYIIAMDSENLTDIKRACPHNATAEIRLFSSFIENCPWDSVPDPWYTGNFDETYSLACEGCDAIIAKLWK